MTSPGSLNDNKIAYYTTNGYTGSLSDMQYAYFSNPPTQMAMGIVRTICPPATTAIGISTIGTWYYRIIEGGTISAIRMYVTTLAGNISVALYKNTGSGLNARPNNRYATSGSLLLSAPTGIKDFSLGGSFAVIAGDWMSIALDDITARTSGVIGVGDGLMSAGMFMTENVFPSPAVANASPANNRMFAMVGVP